MARWMKYDLIALDEVGYVVFQRPDQAPASVRMYLCLSPCDMRRNFDGLHALAQSSAVGSLRNAAGGCPVFRVPHCGVVCE
jgi:hypothetical protein